jgi:hypothetical protein
LYKILGNGNWELQESVVDVENNKVCATVSDFSTFIAASGFPYGDLSGSGDYTILDAMHLLSLSAGLPMVPTGPYSNEDPDFIMKVANVSGGPPSLTILDAMHILRKSAIPSYKFPVELTAPSLISQFQSPNTRTAFLRHSSFAGDTTFSLSLDDATDVFGAEVELVYNPQHLTLSSVSKTSLTSEGAIVYDNKNTGELRILFANAFPLSGADKLLDIQFDLASGASADAFDSVKLTKVKLNDGLIKTNLAASVPYNLMLLQNYPNPFNPETWIPYRLPQASDVEIRIYNVNGQLTRRLCIDKQSAGSYVTKDKAAYWDGTNYNGEKAASGIYFYQLKAGKESIVKKMVILK